MILFEINKPWDSTPLGCQITTNLRGRQRQVGSLAGAAHLLNDNTGVLRSAQ